MVTAAFSGLFLLKMANLFPAELDLGTITVQVEQLAQLLSDVAAERYVDDFTAYVSLSDFIYVLDCLRRYALTLRIMLANLRRKVGLTPSGVPNLMSAPHGAEVIMAPPPYIDPNIGPPPHFSAEDLATWADRGVFSPSAIPIWLQEQVSDLAALIG